MISSSILKTSLSVAVSFFASCNAMAAPAEFSCAQTPSLALGISRLPAGVAAGKDGYRVKMVRWDPLLKQRWAMVTSCDHPERPSIAIQIPDERSEGMQDNLESSGQTIQSPFPIVHAGDLVQLWKQEQNFRIKVAGRAEENGAAGSRVRVRLIPSGFDIGQEQTFIGIVRGPRDVEIER